MILRQFKEDIVLVDVHREIDALVKKNAELLKRLVKARYIFIPNKLFIFIKIVFVNSGLRARIMNSNQAGILLVASLDK